MSTVVGISSFVTRFQQLGWEPPIVNVQEILEAVRGGNVNGAVVIKYLDALIAAPNGLDDSTINGVTAQQGANISTFLKKQGALV